MNKEDGLGSIVKKAAMNAGKAFLIGGLALSLWKYAAFRHDKEL